MNMLEQFREHKRQRREHLRKVVFGDTPRPSRLERVLLVLTVVVGAFICYRFQLVHAHTFGVLGFAFVFLYFAVRRLWFRGKPAPNAGGSS